MRKVLRILFIQAISIGSIMSAAQAQAGLPIEGTWMRSGIACGDGSGNISPGTFKPSEAEKYFLLIENGLFRDWMYAESCDAEIHGQGSYVIKGSNPLTLQMTQTGRNQCGPKHRSLWRGAEPNRTHSFEFKDGQLIETVNGLSCENGQPLLWIYEPAVSV